MCARKPLHLLSKNLSINSVSKIYIHEKQIPDSGNLVFRYFLKLSYCVVIVFLTAFFILTEHQNMNYKQIQHSIKLSKTEYNNYAYKLNIIRIYITWWRWFGFISLLNLSIQIQLYIYFVISNNKWKRVR